MEEVLVERARSEIKRLNLEDRASMIHGDLFNVDLSEADVVTLYLSRHGNERLQPKLERELRKGTLIISHDFEIGNWKPSAVHNVYVLFPQYLWCVPTPVIDPSTHELHMIYSYKIGEQL